MRRARNVPPATPRQPPPRRRRQALLILIAASIVVRLIYFAQINASPLIELHRWDQTDMHYYESWGGTIAGGDWLSRSITVPMHEWHRQLAEHYFTGHPDERRVFEQQAAQVRPPTDAATFLWTTWLGSHRFYQDPLYPYLIGLTYRVFGRDVRYVFAWQLAAGVLTNVLIFLLTERFFGFAAAVWAAVLAVLCGPLMYYDLFLLRESLIVAAGLWLVWLTDRAWTSRSRTQWRWFALLGFSAGAACLLKSSFVLFVGMIAVATIWKFRDRIRVFAVPAAAGTAAFVLALTPLAARNIALGVPPLQLASTGPLTFIISNVVGFPVDKGFAIDIPRVAPLMSATAGHPAAAILETLRSQTAGSFASQLWKKVEFSWLWYEIPNNEDFYYTRLRAPILAVLPLTFWIVGSFGLVGLALSVRNSRLGGRASRTAAPWLLYALVASTLAQLIVFYVIGRFRAPLLAALVPFASLTIVQCGRWLSARDVRPLGITAAALAAVLLWTGRTSPVTQPLIRPADWFSPFLVKYEAEMQRAVDERNPGRAAAAFLEYFRYEPDVAEILATNSPELALGLGRMHQDCADLLRQSGQSDLANVQDVQAAALLRLAGR